MIPTEDILKTIEMVQLENLDVRAVTLGINLMCCADGDADRMVGKIRSRIHSVAENLVTCCDEVSAKYGISIVNKRLAVSKISSLLEAHGAHVCIPLARVLDEAASGVGVDIIGGYTALVQKGGSARRGHRAQPRRAEYQDSRHSRRAGQPHGLSSDARTES